MNPESAVETKFQRIEKLLLLIGVKSPHFQYTVLERGSAYGQPPHPTLQCAARADIATFVSLETALNRVGLRRLAAASGCSKGLTDWRIAPMKKVRIGKRLVGDGEPAFLVAEIGINHQGSRDIAEALIEASAVAGADAVKFQKRTIDRIFTRAALDAPYSNNGNSFGRTYGEHRRALELSREDYKYLKACADRKGLIFFASAWDEESADFLVDLGVPVLKIGSPDLTNLPLCEHVARKGLPVILSTGMAERCEVEKAVRTVMRHNENLILLHCTSIYPADYSEINLGLINALKESFEVPVGYSGHEHGWEIAFAARAIGACVIEKHITLDRSMKGGDHCLSLLPQEFAQLTRAVRRLEMAFKGNGKRLYPREIPFRNKLAKSLVASRLIRKGEVITRDAIVCKSPGGGISPIFIDDVVGCIARETIPEDSLIDPAMLCRTVNGAITERIHNE